MWCAEIHGALGRVLDGRGVALDAREVLPLAPGTRVFVSVSWAGAKAYQLARSRLTSECSRLFCRAYSLPHSRMRSSGVHSLARNGVLPGGWWRTGELDSAWRATSISYSEPMDSLVIERCKGGWLARKGDESGRVGWGWDKDGAWRRSHCRWRRRSKYSSPRRNGEDGACEELGGSSSSMWLLMLGAPHTGGGGMRDET
jgi:hypothetical protein